MPLDLLNRLRARPSLPIRFAQPLFLLTVWLLIAGPARSQQPILAGLDLLETNPGETFCDLSNLDLLCPGCTVIGDPIVPLQGIPMDQSAACMDPIPGEVDTIIRRPFDTVIFFPGEEVNVEIELVELHLESVQPFQVDCQGDQQSWMVTVGLDPQGQQQGQMRVVKTHENGGFLIGGILVEPRYIFTRVDEDPPVDLCEVFPGPQDFQLDGPWVHEVNEFPLLEIPGCTSNFVPGIEGDGGEELFGILAQSTTQNDQIHWFPAVDATSSTPDAAPNLLSGLLRPASPNPFTESTSLYYRIESEGPVRIDVYNVTGQAVRNLVDDARTVGDHRVGWDGRDQSGRRVSSGVYTYILRTQTGHESRTFTLLH